MKKLDLAGQSFHYLTVLERDSESRDKYHTYWLCSCICGEIKSIRGSAIMSGQQSCGCLIAELGKAKLYKHGYYYHTAYSTWAKMLNRCHNPKSPDYYLYGGRGIYVCERWRLSVIDFCEDMGDRPYGMSLDRIDNDLGYCPDNCRWADTFTQANNRRTCIYLDTPDGRRTCAQIARDHNLSYKRLHYAITKLKLSLNEAMYFSKCPSGTTIREISTMS